MITFNYMPFDGIKAPISNTKGGVPCEVIDIKTIDINSLANMPKEYRPWIQMFDAGYRVWEIERNDYEQMKFWNGCVFVDLDLGHYHGRYESELSNVVVQLSERLAWNLSQYFPKTFYWLQRSHSGKSIHFVFYFDVEKTISNFKKCAWLAQSFVIDDLKNHISAEKLEDIINYPSVIDNCGQKVAQCLFMSGNPILFNHNCNEPNGECNIDSYEYNEDDSEDDYIDVEFVRSNYTEITFKKFDYKAFSDWSHPTRFSLYKVFAHYFLDDVEAAEKAYSEVAPYISESYIKHNPKYTTKAVISEFKTQYKNTVLKPVLKELQKPVEQRTVKYGKLSAKMVKFFCSCFNADFKVTTVFTPQRIDRTDYTKVYTLESNQYISDVLGDILSLPNNFIHIEAGCGLGKTFALKEWIRQQQINSDNLFDVQSKKRVCFVTPMTSINRDNFTDESDWVIVDSEHKGAINQLTNNKSVCTTWNSFILFEMDQMNFDLYVFDESHSLFLYDYRAKDIADVLYSLNRLHQQNKRVVLMSGTPSKDRELFADMAKVKVTKNVSKIPANVIVYQEQYNGWLFNDVREWIKDKTHVALVMYDYANLTLKDSFEKRGIAVDLLYNKRFDEDVEFVNRTHSLKGQVTLCSTYGQAGINIYADSKQLVRLYIISDCALSIIQYANRIRNKDRVESINIVYKAEKVRNSIKSYQVPDRYDLEQRLAVINSSYAADKDWLIECRLGLREMYLKEIDDADGKRVRAIDNDIYNAFVNCESVVMYESQLQLIYNRLVDANFLFNIVQMQSDVKDEYICKKSGKVASVLQNKNQIMKCIVMDKRGLYINDRLDKQVRELIDDTTQKKLEDIINYLFDQYTTDEKLRNEYKDYMSYIDSVYCKFVERIIKNDSEKSVTKADVKRFAKAVEMRKKIMSNNLADGVVGSFLSGDVTDEMIMSAAAAHVSIVYGGEWLDWQRLKDMADETYKLLKEALKIIREFDWLFDFSSDDDSEMKKTREQSELVEIKSQLFDYLKEKHKKGGAKSVVRAMSASGFVKYEFATIEDAAKQFNVSVTTMKRHIKSGEYICKLGYSFVLIKY